MCNDIGQVYYGPVVLITDALSYSTTDIFAAGFQDNEIGEILGTSGNTGAGGANVWWYEDLRTAFGGGSSSPFKALPKGADMVVAMRRSIRVGLRAGRPLEELGIAPDKRHFLTKRDILQHNEDLLATAVDMLAKRAVYKLTITEGSSRSSRTLNIAASSEVSSEDKSSNISRVDVYVDGKPTKSIPATNGSIRSSRLSLPRKTKGELRLEAYDMTNRLVAARRKMPGD